MIRSMVWIAIPGRRALGRWLRALNAMAASWHRRACDRRRLATMSPRELRDIGIHPGDVSQEVRKPFWRR